jgi:hypothetical protein
MNQRLTQFEGQAVIQLHMHGGKEVAIDGELDSTIERPNCLRLWSVTKRIDFLHNLPKLVKIITFM